MTNANDVRRAHEILDDISIGHQPNEGNLNHLRSFLPELPAQKTAEELTKHVFSALATSCGDEWGGGGYGPEITLEHWLEDLHKQLQGLKDTPATVPALPVGIRLADHEQYGRVITSPKPNRDGVYDLLVSRPEFETGADWEYAHECELTFVDAEPAAPAHPEFLQTGAEYQEAPWGTVVAMENAGTAWIKKTDWWLNTDGDGRTDGQQLWGVPREVLRWGHE